MKKTAYKLFTLLWVLISIQSVSAGYIEDAVSRLTPDQQNWINQSCPRSFGPSLWKSCMNRELYAINSSIPNASGVSQSDLNWVNQSCPGSFGPSLWKSCMERELSAVKTGMPNLNSLSPNNKAWVLQSCPYSFGPSLWKSCVNREMNALR